MNEANNQSIHELVAGYESMSEGGAVTFMDERAYERLIEYYEQEELLERALEVVEYALSQYPYSIDFYTKRAQLQLWSNQPEAALTSLEQAAIYSPLEPDIFLLRAEAYIALDRQEEAQGILDDLKHGADRELMANIYFIEALIAEQQELYESMYFSLVAALRENPSHRDALERIWITIELCKRYDEAADLFEQILEIDAYSSLAWFHLGQIRAYHGQYAEAIEAYEYAYLTDEQLEAAYRECGELCLQMRHYHRALRCYEELLEHFEADNDVLLRLGQCHQQLGNIKIARTFYLQALQHDPSDDEVLFHLGECYALDEDWAKAIRYFNKAIRIEDTREEYFGALAVAYYRSGKIDKAETNFEIAIETAPEESRYWIQYMRFLLDIGRGEDALEVIEEAEDYATGSELLYGRVACLITLGRRQEALYWLGEALEEDFDQHRMLFDVIPHLERDPDVVSLIVARTL